MPRLKHTQLRVAHNAELTLADISTEPPPQIMAQASDWEHALKKLGARLDALQSLLHAGKSKAVLLVLQGMDTSGKDGVIRSVFSNVSPLGVRAEAFGAPSEEEKKHDFLWRIHAKMPALGEIAVFNRSHYEDVLVTRVRGWIDKKTWQQRYQHIRNFEAMLHDSGVTVLKCYLHISKGEQKNVCKHVWTIRANTGNCRPPTLKTASSGPITRPHIKTRWQPPVPPKPRGV